MYGMVGRAGLEAFASRSQLRLASATTGPGARTADSEQSCHTPAKDRESRGQALGGDPAFAAGESVGAHMSAVAANAAWGGSDLRAGAVDTTLNALARDEPSNDHATFDVERDQRAGRGRGRAEYLAFNALLTVASVAGAGFASWSIGILGLPQLLRRDSLGNGFGTLGLLGVKHLDFWSGSTWCAHYQLRCHRCASESSLWQAGQCRELPRVRLGYCGRGEAKPTARTSLPVFELLHSGCSRRVDNPRLRRCMRACCILG